MKNLTALLTFTTAVLLSIPAVKYFLNVNSISRNLSLISSKNSKSDFDRSLRNFHPNKGE